MTTVSITTLIPNDWPPIGFAGLIWINLGWLVESMLTQCLGGYARGGSSPFQLIDAAWDEFATKVGMPSMSCWQHSPSDSHSKW